MAEEKNLGKILARRAGVQDHRRVNKDIFRESEGPGQTAQFSKQIFPPWVYKLPMSVDYNKNVFSSILPLGAGSTIVPVSFQIPPTFVGYQQIFGIYILTPTALTDITFSLRINGGPVEGWDNIAFPPGVANFVVQNFSGLQVNLPDGANVDVLVTNNNAQGPWTVGAKISGWYHPYTEEQRIYGSL